MGDNWIEMQVDCAQCNGTGLYKQASPGGDIDITCPFCKGTGVFKYGRVKVKVLADALEAIKLKLGIEP